MVACYSCHRLTHPIRPHGGILPVYCPRCLREVVDQIMQDVAAAGLLQIRVKPSDTVPRDWHPLPEEFEESHV